MIPTQLYTETNIIYKLLLFVNVNYIYPRLLYNIYTKLSREVYRFLGKINSPNCGETLEPEFDEDDEEEPF